VHEEQPTMAGGLLMNGVAAIEHDAKHHLQWPESRIYMRGQLHI
jgi:hypothetical protein